MNSGKQVTHFVTLFDSPLSAARANGAQSLLGSLGWGFQDTGAIMSADVYNAQRGLPSSQWPEGISGLPLLNKLSPLYRPGQVCFSPRPATVVYTATEGHVLI